ncbi:MAG TPA: ABC transporter substrate-binding protein [Chloroflexota bacterium]|nr:ABC transporter substrate-binding protein [Chloroflexota bacterium]
MSSPLRSRRSISRRAFLGGAALGAAAAALAACSPAARPAQSSAPRELKIAFVNIAGVNAPVWLAEATGAFTQHGLNVKSQLIEGNIAAKALIAKEVDLLLQAAAPIITADLNGGADLVMLASSFNHSLHALVTPAEIRTPADFKGKILGSDRPGSTNDYQNRVILGLMGLQPSDVTIRVLGGSDSLLPALLSGQIQGAALSPPQIYQAEEAGFHVLQDTYSQPYQGGGWVTSRARLDELAPAMPPFLAAFRQGMITFRQQPDLAKRILSERTKTDDPVQLDKTYDFFVKTAPFQEDLRPTMEGIQRMLDYLSDAVPAAKQAKPEQFVDLRFLS